MTGDLLQSDIELARRLIAAGESDAQIIVALGYRKIAPVKAQRLIRELRSGLEVQPDPEPESFARTRLNSAVETAPIGDVGAHDFEGGAYAPKASDSQAIPWFRIAFLTGIGICLAAVFLVNPRSRKMAATTPRELSPQRETAQTGQAPKIEIEAQSLRVCGMPLTRQNALAMLSELFGAPAHTNQLPEFTIYAFDQQGIVLYSQNRAGRDSLLVYFEPVGGASGAKNPFHGTLAVQGNPITSNTSSTNLATIPQLTLSETISNVFSGQCGKLDVSFAYLKSADHLSLIQIDLD